MEYDAIVKVEWATTFEAESKEDFLVMVKDQWKDDYNIDLEDDEIFVLGEIIEYASRRDMFMDNPIKKGEE